MRSRNEYMCGDGCVQLSTSYKVGVLLSSSGQCSEEELYNNECTTPAFEQFLALLGERVLLRGWPAYRGGLDTRGTRVLILYLLYTPTAHTILHSITHVSSNLSAAHHLQFSITPRARAPSSNVKRSAVTSSLLSSFKTSFPTLTAFHLH